MTIYDLYETAHKARCRTLRVRNESDYTVIDNAFTDAMLKRYGDLKVYCIYTEPFVKDRVVQTRLCAVVFSGDIKDIKNGNK